MAHPDESLEVDALSWSPDGDWLGWVSAAMGDADPWAGTLRVDGSEAGRALLPGNVSSIAVADGGDSVLGRVNGTLFLLPLQGVPEPVPTTVSVGVGAYSPSGSQVALGGGPGRATYTLDVRTRQLLRVTEPAALTAYAVSTRVNSVQNNDPSLLEPLPTEGVTETDPAPEQPPLV